ncbi:MAG: M20/M25/M40 family metallo-hydrolase [Acidobacteriota bacterium]|nr:M20/M25/M40 family metallo-hydrolase [Acidobacteriota bacterium]
MRIRLVAIFLMLSGLATAQQPDFDKARAEAVEHLTALVKLDTSNPPGNEILAARYIKSVLDREGIASEIFESAPGRASIVARLAGNGKKKPLLLMGHLDVVGVEREHWTVDPFAALIKDGYLYGRGSSDDKGMDAANLEVFLLLHRLKVPLDRDVILLAEAGEEGTSEFGIDFLVEKHWDKIECEYALNEGGETEIRDGKVKFVGVSTTQKVPRGMLVTARGSSGHGSMPRMDNAVTHLAAAVAKIGDWQSPMRLNETTRTFFERLAKISPPEEAYLYTHLEDPAVQAKLRATELRYNSMLRTSIVPTIIQGGFRENVIPAVATATLDVRALPDEDIDQLLATLRKLVNDPAVTIERRTTGQRRPAPPPTRLDTEMFQALERAQQKVFPGAVTVPIMQTGATDSAQLRAKGVQAYDIAIPESMEEARRIHGNDERVSVEALGQFIQYVYAAVTDVAGAK